MTRTRAAVLESATSLLLDGGLSAVTIDRLVESSGVAKTTIYRHWTGRAELIWDTLNALIPAPPEPQIDGSITTNLIRFIAASGRELAQAPWVSVIPALLDAADRDPELLEFRSRIAERHLRPLKQILLAGVERGELDPGLNLNEAMSFLMGPMLYRRLVTHEPLDRTYCTQLVERFIRSIG